MGTITAYPLNSVNIVFDMIIFLQYMVENIKWIKWIYCPLIHMIELILGHYITMSGVPNFVQPGQAIPTTWLRYAMV